MGYWIRCIEQLISNDNVNKIEVIVLENKIDNNKYLATYLNQYEYSNKYPNLNLHFTNCSLKPLKRISGVKELIQEKIETLCKSYQYSYVKYLKEINKSQDAVIDISNIQTKNNDELKRAIQVFHNMGILLYYPAIIPDKIFIQPQELLNLLYQQILDTRKREQITLEQIEESIENNVLSLSSEEVIKLLKHFNLVFQIPDADNIYFVPQYLKMPPTFIDFFEKYQFQKANICIKSDNYLMNLAMLKVFAEYGKYVKGKATKEYLFWKDGIVIEKNDSLLMVKFNREKQSIELFPDFNNSNFELQKELIAFILDTHKIEPKTYLKQDETWGNIHDEMWDNSNFSIFVSLDGDYFTEWKKLKENREKGIFQIEAMSISNTKEIKEKTLSVFDYNKYLPQNKQGQMKKIFISYSKDDLKLVNKFIEHLSALKLNGKVEHWYCTELLAGKEWDYEIQKHFDDADIVCFMISPNFMRTKYIHEYEIKKAFERREKIPNFKIVPIILDFCRWSTEINNLADFTALPYTAKPVVDFLNQNMAWYIIEECLRIMIDNDLEPQGDDLFRNYIDLPKDVKRIFERIVEQKVDKNSE